jgi:hypothetical protein
MSSCAFIQVENYHGEVAFINPDHVRKFEPYSNDGVIIYFNVDDHFIAKCLMEDFKQALVQSNYWIKKAY